jgi:hypothetical protein
MTKSSEEWVPRQTLMCCLRRDYFSDQAIKVGGAQANINVLLKEGPLF